MKSAAYAFSFAVISALAVGMRLPAAEPSATAGSVVVPPKEDTRLSFDATTKEYVAKPGEHSCTFRFLVRNTSDSEVVVNQVRTSCGCTVAKLPSQPWRIAPGSSETLELTMDLRGESGEFIRTATLDMPTTYRTLLMKVTIPRAESPMSSPQDRERNRQIATADRQAVFQGSCAACHAAPAKNRKGAALYVSACAICHEAEHRASIVPDLHALAETKDAMFWRTTVTNGKPGTLMPAFATEHGGPLATDQIESLVEYLTSDFRKKRLAAQRPSAAPAAP